jgi:ubiquinone biosynthesis protein COQ4
MEADAEGARVLLERPRVRGAAFHPDALATYPSNSFARKYLDYLAVHEFSPEERPVVNHIGDINLAYIL